MFWNRRPRVYSARGMTGCTMRDLVREAENDKWFFNQHGIEVIDPVIEEKVEDVNKVLTSLDEAELKAKWYADKKFIRYVDVVAHMTADRYSVGGVLETGYHRFFLWAPTIWVSPKQAMGHLTVAKFELDDIVANRRELVLTIRTQYWTWWQRFCWRLPIELKGLPWLLWCHIGKFF